MTTYNKKYRKDFLEDFKDILDKYKDLTPKQIEFAIYFLYSDKTPDERIIELDISLTTYYRWYNKDRIVELIQELNKNTMSMIAIKAEVRLNKLVDSKDERVAGDNVRFALNRIDKLNGFGNVKVEIDATTYLLDALKGE